MAKLFGQIEDTEIADLPESLQNIIKASSAEAEKSAGLAEQIAELQKRMKPAEEPPEKPDNELDAAALQAVMIYDTRMETILTRYRSSKDKMDSTCLELFEDEIRDNLGKSAPQLRADAAYVKNIIDLVKGRHLQEIIAALKANDQTSRYNSLFTESGGSGSKSAPPAKNLAEGLSAEEKKAADSYGIDHETYAKSLAEVKGVA